MQVYILRHGIAEAPAAGRNDADRALAPGGKETLRAVLRAARSAGVSPNIIAASPYRRAVETATVAAGIFGHKDQIIEFGSLRPGHAPEDVWDDIRSLGVGQRIMLCGHMPQLGYLTGFLLGTPSLLIEPREADLIHIDMNRLGSTPRGTLRWYLTPELALHCSNAG